MLGLALSGGAARGAWQAGRAHSLARQWEIVAGVSVGSVNAAHLAQYELGDEARAMEDLRVLWHSLRTRDVHRRWFPFGALHSLWRTGVRDVRPLRKFLCRHLSPARIIASGRGLRIAAVCYATRQWRVWTEEDAAGVVDQVMASCAIPYAFEPQAVAGVRYVDGGVRTVVPFATLVQAGCTEVDAIVCFPDPPPIAEPPGNALEAGLASVDTQSYQLILDDLQTPQVPCELHVYRPDRDLGDGLDFSPETNAWRWQLGADE